MYYNNTLWELECLELLFPLPLLLSVRQVITILLRAYNGNRQLAYSVGDNRFSASPTYIYTMKQQNHKHKCQNCAVSLNFNCAAQLNDTLQSACMIPTEGIISDTYSLRTTDYQRLLQYVLLQLTLEGHKLDHALVDTTVLKLYYSKHRVLTFLVNYHSYQCNCYHNA